MLPLPLGVVMHALWFELIHYCELSRVERRNVLLARRQMLFEQHARLMQEQQELEERQLRLEQQQHAFKPNWRNKASAKEM
jgi:hypothetical protein